MKDKKAKVFWVPSESGGRKSLPFGDKYAPFIVDKGQSLRTQKELWSVFVSNKAIVDKHTTIACLHYLSEEAPNKLVLGYEFDLYEGPKKVATGRIVEDK